MAAPNGSSDTIETDDADLREIIKFCSLELKGNSVISQLMWSVLFLWHVRL